MAIGTDIVELSRVRRAAQHPAFWQRILTASEEAYCRSKGDGIASLAGRFAAKEAVMKCLGLGMDRLSFVDIEILNDFKGTPQVYPGTVLSEIMAEQKVAEIEISISHCREYATAVALSR